MLNIKKTIITAIFILITASGFAQAETETEAKNKAALIITQADNGDSEAQLLAGDLYAFGESGVKQDYMQAFKWYERSALQGNAVAQYNLGVILLVGHHDKESKQYGVRMLRAAADSDIPLAQFNLGVAHAQGHGVKKDHAAAKLWFDKACKNGIKDGCTNYQEP